MEMLNRENPVIKIVIVIFNTNIAFHLRTFCYWRGTKVSRCTHPLEHVSQAPVLVKILSQY